MDSADLSCVTKRTTYSGFNNNDLFIIIYYVQKDSRGGIVHIINKIMIVKLLTYCDYYYY